MRSSIAGLGRSFTAVISVLALVAGLMVAGSSVASATEVEAPQTELGSIAGKVNFPEGADSSDIKNVELLASADTSGSTTAVDSSGTFEFPEVEAGSYRVRINGQTDKVLDQYFDGTLDATESKIVAVEPGEAVKLSDWNLLPAPSTPSPEAEAPDEVDETDDKPVLEPANESKDEDTPKKPKEQSKGVASSQMGTLDASSISGTITLPQGEVQDFSSFEVFAELNTEDEWDYQYTSVDEHGNYSFDELISGALYRVVVSDYSNKYFSKQVNDVLVPSENVDFALELAGSISGSVTVAGSEDQVLVGQVSAFNSDNGDYVSQSSVDEGSYEIRGLDPEGSYKLKFEDWDGTYLEQWYNGASSFEAANPVETGVEADFLVASAASISGTVTVAGGGVPVETGGLYVEAYFADDEVASSSNVEEDGSYEIRGLDPSVEYKLRFIDYNDEYSSQWHGGTNFDTAVPVTPGGLAVNFEIELRGSISGTVDLDDIDSEGLELRIRAYPVGSEDSEASAEVDLETGEYQLEGLDAGLWELELVDYSESYRIQSQWYDQVELRDEATGVLVTGGADTSQINFVPKLTNTISGTVVAPNGESLDPDAESRIVVCEWYTYEDEDGSHTDCEPTGSAQVDQDGAYTVSGLVAGREYSAYFYDRNYVYKNQWYNGDSGGTEDPAEATKFDGETSHSGINFDLVKQNLGTISGKVDLSNVDVDPDEGWIELYVVLYSADESRDWVSDAFVNLETGDYTIRGIELDRSYKLKLYIDGDTSYIGQWYNAVATFEQAESISVTEQNKNISGKNFTPIEGGSISGTVTGGQNVDFTNWEIQAYEDGEEDYSRSITLDEDGSYTINRLVPGQSYKLRLRSEQGTYATQWFNGKADRNSADAIAIPTTNKNVTGKNFTLIQAGSISGFLVDESGNPIEPSEDEWRGIVAFDANDPNSYVSDGWVNEGGSYTVDGLFPGQSYKLRFSDEYDAYPVQWYEGKFTFGSANEVLVSHTNPHVTGLNFTILDQEPEPTVPDAPAITSVTPGNGQLTVNFTQGSDGGSEIIRYEYSLDGGENWLTHNPVVTSSPMVIAGLTNGNHYVIELRAVNAEGESVSSNAVSGTPRTVPAAPTSISARAGSKQATVSWTVGSNGGSAFTSFTARANNGRTCTTTNSTSCTITGLTPGSKYTFTVTANNAAGTSAASAASGAVTIPKLNQTLGKSKSSMKRKKKLKLPVKTNAGAKVKWKSLSSKICTVNSKGVVKAKNRKGTCKVQATAPATAQYNALKKTNRNIKVK